MLLMLAALAGAVEVQTEAGSIPETDVGVGHHYLDVPALLEGRGIINGGEMSKEEWPEAGAILSMFDANFGNQRVSLTNLSCSSTLIAPDVVLTAGHCVEDNELGIILEAQAGGVLTDVEVTGFAWSRRKDLADFDLISALQGGKPLPNDAIEAAGWKVHNKYSLFTLQTGLAKNNDIALVFLSEAVFDTPFMLLPSQEEADALQVNDPLVVVGWGQQAQDPYAGYGVKMGGDSFVAEVSDWEFKVGEEINDVRKCHGDSGGPSFAQVGATHDHDDGYRVIGVTSHAYDNTDCAQTGGVDTRVGFFLDWIEREMVKACDNGTRVWCDEETGIIAPPNADGLYSWEAEALAAAEAEAEAAKGGCDTTAGSTSLLGLFALFGLMRRRQ